MSFSVTILGSGSAVPTKQRNPTSQYVECNGRNFLIDCGEGTQMQIRKFGIKFQKINHIFISHLHGDHYFGLVGLLSSMHLMGRVKPIDIFGPIGLEQIVRIQLEAAGSRLAYDVNVIELEPNTNGVIYEDGKVSVSHFPLVHRIQTNGFRIEQKPREHRLLADKARLHGVKIEYYHRLKKGEDVTDEDGKLIRFKDYTRPSGAPKSYAYCSDTAYTESILPFIDGVDVLYHESTFTESMADRAKATRHSTAKQAATIALKAGVGKLLMGHLSARYENGDEHLAEAKPIFDACEYVEDGKVYQINSL